MNVSSECTRTLRTFYSVVKNQAWVESPICVLDAGEDGLISSASFDILPSQRKKIRLEKDTARKDAGTAVAKWGKIMDEILQQVRIIYFVLGRLFRQSVDRLGRLFRQSVDRPQMHGHGQVVVRQGIQAPRDLRPPKVAELPPVCGRDRLGHLPGLRRGLPDGDLRRGGRVGRVVRPVVVPEVVHEHADLVVWRRVVF